MGAAAEEVARKALAATSTDGLLRAFAALTHRMHAETELCSETDGERHDEHVLRRADLREQRDPIRDEILRRTGDLR